MLVCISTSYIITSGGRVAVRICTIIVGKFDIKMIDDSHCKYIIIKVKKKKKKKESFVIR